MWRLLVLVLLAHALGCGTTDGAVRTGATPPSDVTVIMTHPGSRVIISDAEFRAAMAWLAADVASARVSLSPAPQPGRIVVAAWEGSHDRAGAQLAREYSAWCQRVRHGPPDCLSLGAESLGFEAKRRLALSIAVGSVLLGAADVIGEVADPIKLEVMLLGTIGTYLFLLCAPIPEPVTKGLAAVMTVTLYAYLGHELWGIVKAYSRMLDEADVATTFAEIHTAGDAFGTSVGQNATRILIMVATARLGSKMDRSVKRLPGFGAASKAVAFKTPTAAGTTVGGESLTLAGALGNVNTAVLGKGHLGLLLGTGAMAMTSGGSDGSSAPRSVRQSDNPTEKPWISESRAKHIFRGSRGHLPDTQENRRLLQELAADKSARLGTDKYGNVWSAKLNPDGTQTWVQVRHGEIINGGLNQAPHPFNPETGLSAPVKPGG